MRFDGESSAWAAPTLVNDVDRAVGQLAIIDVACRQFNSRADRLICEPNIVMLFVIGLEATQDLHGILDRRFVHVDLLEAAHQGAVFLEVAPILLVGRRPDTTQLAAGQGWLEKVRRIHGTAGCSPGADDRVDFIDEEHRALHIFDFGDDRLQAFLESHRDSACRPAALPYREQISGRLREPRGLHHRRCAWPGPQR